MPITAHTVILWVVYRCISFNIRVKVRHPMIQSIRPIAYQYNLNEVWQYVYIDLDYD